MMIKTRWKALVTIALAPVLMAVSGQAVSQTSGFYKDKVINIVVGGGASGGHTRYARLIQPFLQKHTGAREVRITLMPGGGGLKAANFIWRAKPDGFTIFFGNVSTLILAPLAGWLYASAAGLSVNWFGLIQVPDLVAKDRELAEVFKALHIGLVALIALLLAAHIGGALRHAFVRRDGIMHRMLPWKPDRKS